MFCIALIKLIRGMYLDQLALMTTLSCVSAFKRLYITYGDIVVSCTIY